MLAIYKFSEETRAKILSEVRAFPKLMEEIASGLEQSAEQYASTQNYQDAADQFKSAKTHRYAISTFTWCRDEDFIEKLTDTQLIHELRSTSNRCCAYIAHSKNTQTPLCAANKQVSSYINKILFDTAGLHLNPNQEQLAEEMTQNQLDNSEAIKLKLIEALGGDIDANTLNSMVELYNSAI